ncbi:MAG: YraN family protein [Oligoflexia bacterium]|nr:YraN family protein [Oligoflexia bacterium]
MSTGASFLESENFWISNNKVELGRRGEQLVIELLQNQGFCLRERNLRTPFGEIDIIGSFDSTLLIIEVKTRHKTSLENSIALNFVGRVQLQRLKRAATWIWQREGRSFAKMRCGLVVVTECGIRWFNLPLLYDQC